MLLFGSDVMVANPELDTNSGAGLEEVTTNDGGRELDVTCGDDDIATGAADDEDTTGGLKDVDMGADVLGVNGVDDENVRLELRGGGDDDDALVNICEDEGLELTTADRVVAAEALDEAVAAIADTVLEEVVAVGTVNRKLSHCPRTSKLLKHRSTFSERLVPTLRPADAESGSRETMMGGRENGGMPTDAETPSDADAPISTEVETAGMPSEAEMAGKAMDALI